MRRALLNAQPCVCIRLARIRALSSSIRPLWFTLSPPQPRADQSRLAPAWAPLARFLATHADTTPPLNLTTNALKQLNRIQARESNPRLALRIGVTSGGCAGYQYVLGLADTSKEDEYDKDEDQLLHFAIEASPESSPDRATPLVVVDNTSLALIRGSTVDFATELIGSAFRIQDNPQSKSKGCGCGVSWELRDDFELPD